MISLKEPVLGPVIQIGLQGYADLDEGSRGVAKGEDHGEERIVLGQNSSKTLMARKQNCPVSVNKSTVRDRSNTNIERGCLVQVRRAKSLRENLLQELAQDPPGLEIAKAWASVRQGKPPVHSVTGLLPRPWLLTPGAAFAVFAHQNSYAIAAQYHNLHSRGVWQGNSGTLGVFHRIFDAGPCT